MLPNLSNILKTVTRFFPDRLSFQEEGTATMDSRGNPIPGAWQNVSGLQSIPCLMETYFLRRSNDGEILSEEGQVEVNTYRVLMDHTYAVLPEMQCVDQNSIVYQVQQVTRDDWDIGTLLKIQVIT